MGPILSEYKELNWTMEKTGFSEQQGKGYAYGTTFPPVAFPKFAIHDALFFFSYLMVFVFCTIHLLYEISLA